MLVCVRVYVWGGEDGAVGRGAFYLFIFVIALSGISNYVTISFPFVFTFTFLCSNHPAMTQSG